MEEEEKEEEEEPIEKHRFHVEWHNPRSFYGLREKGYAVYDRQIRITIIYPTREEAERHMSNIAKYYEEWGW